jgi:hypothetical protein
MCDVRVILDLRQWRTLSASVDVRRCSSAPSHSCPAFIRVRDLTLSLLSELHNRCVVSSCVLARNARVRARGCVFVIPGGYSHAPLNVRNQNRSWRLVKDIPHAW